MIAHPLVAYRDCSHCQLYHYNEETGKPYEGRAGGLAKRHLGCPPPCRTHTGCPKGTPEESKELSLRNCFALDHYRECKATGLFPDDPIVKRNAKIISELMKHPEEKHRNEVSALLKGLIYG